MKTCFICKRILPIEEFYRHPAMGDGHLGKCKECTRRHSIENRHRNLEMVRAKDRERAKSGKRKKSIQIWSNNYRQKFPIKYKAHRAVGTALRDGRLIKKPCEVCGSKQVHAHHDDYAKPINVRWLCAVHHFEHHAQFGEGLNATRYS